MRNNILNEQDIECVRRYYRAGIARFGATFESLYSGSQQKSEVRSRIHASAILRQPAAILDVGCGVGFFYEFLRRHKYKVDYVGYDIMPEYIDVCRKTYPDANFMLRNIFDEGFDAVYDTVVMSQVFNHRYAESDNVAVVKRAIALAFENSRVSVSVDMLSKYVDYENDILFYFSPEEMLAFAKRLTNRVVLRHDYRRFEFTIQLIHDAHGDYVP